MLAATFRDANAWAAGLGLKIPGSINRLNFCRSSCSGPLNCSSEGAAAWCCCRRRSAAAARSEAEIGAAVGGGDAILSGCGKKQPCSDSHSGAGLVSISTNIIFYTSSSKTEERSPNTSIKPSSDSELSVLHASSAGSMETSFRVAAGAKVERDFVRSLVKKLSEPECDERVAEGGETWFLSPAFKRLDAHFRRAAGERRGSC